MSTQQDLENYNEERRQQFNDEEEFRSQYIASFIPNSTRSRCRILREYESQYHQNGIVKNRKTFKSLSWYAEQNNIEKKELCRHWECIEKGVICDE